MGKQDCICEHFKTFKEKLRLQKQLEQEMTKKHGRNNFTMSVLDNCIMVVFPSATTFF